MAYNFSRYPTLLPQYNPILFPYGCYTRVTQIQPRSAHSAWESSDVGNPSVQKNNLKSDGSPYLTAGTRLQHVAGIYFHCYRLQSRLSWPQMSTPSRIKNTQAPLTSGTRLVHASGEYLHNSYLKSRVVWPETVSATVPTLPSQSLLLRPAPIRSETEHPLLVPPVFLGSELNNLNIRISDVLDVDIGWRRQARWDHSGLSIIRLAAAGSAYRPTKSRELSLDLDWQESTVDHLRDSGLLLFESLFALLIEEEQPRGSYARPISRFKNISISVPSVVKVNAKPDGGNHDCIQFLHASSLREFSWKGHFRFFTSKFWSMPFLRLTVLKMSFCLMSLEDALTLLNNCPLLTSATLDAIQHVADSAYKLFGPRELPNIVLPFLDYMEIASSVPLAPLFRNLGWGSTLRDLVLVLEEEGIKDIMTYTRHLQPVQNLSIRGHLAETDVVELIGFVGYLELNGHGIIQ